MEEMQKRLTIVKKRILQHIRHPYLLQYIHTPVIDEDKLMLLLCMMAEQDITAEEVEQYALTTMLVQLALDTHETVSNASYAEDEYHLEKERQLTVLGGIYYSSLYYRLLAEMGNIHLTRVLALAIKEINEHKIYVYQKSNATLDQLMNSYMKIESSLFEGIADHYDAPHWKALTSNFLFLKRLQMERNQFIEQSTSSLFENIKKNVFPNEKNDLSKLTPDQQHYLIDVCDRFANRSITVIERTLKQSPPIDRVLEKRIRAMVEQYPCKGKTYVGEG